MCALDESIEKLTEFGGFDLKFRDHWTPQWHAKLRPTHNNQKHLRIQRSGDSPREAIRKLVAAAVEAAICCEK